MNYIESNFLIDPFSTDNCDIISAMLGDIGYESFSETTEGVLAYIPENLFNEQQVKEVIANLSSFIPSISYSNKTIQDRNWNEEWEKNFDPIIIKDECLIRAPFHNIEKSYASEIIIEPKMSFGTGHHSTTALMIELMMDVKLNNKKVLDMGCGTGILAIFAAQKGASKLTAIDIDSWSYENTIENIERNNVSSIEVKLGDASLLNNQQYDIILANINRNILLADMDTYKKCLVSDGNILFSGFYTEDLDLIKEKAKELGLTFIKYIENKNWVAAHFTN